MFDLAEAPVVSVMSAQHDAELVRHVAQRMQTLLAHHYFVACRNGHMDRARTIEVVKQLYCFSVFFERILTRRIANYTSQRNRELLRIARQHLREEIGHADEFRACLLTHGLSPADVDALTPSLFTKALFGYLLATVDYENEYVANVAIMQVMESIGLQFFTLTRRVIAHHGMLTEAFDNHAADDADHANLGLSTYKSCDRETIQACKRVVDDMFKLMSLALDEWMTLPA